MLTLGGWFGVGLRIVNRSSTAPVSRMNDMSSRLPSTSITTEPMRSSEKYIAGCGVGLNCAVLPPFQDVA